MGKIVFDVDNGNFFKKVSLNCRRLKKRKKQICFLLIVEYQSLQQVKSNIKKLNFGIGIRHNMENVKHIFSE